MVSFIGQFIYGYDLKRKVIDVKVKKLLALIIVISIILCLASCTSSPYDEGYEAGYHDGENEGYQEGFDDGEEAGYEYYVERAEESFDANEIIEWVLSHYTIADLMEWLNTPPEMVPLDRTNGAAKPLKWCMVTAAMVH